MTIIDKYKKAFTEKAINSGFSDDEIQKCLQYAEPILQKGLPVIYNTTHLSSLVGYNKRYLKRASAYTKYFYKQHVIPKKNNDFRYLYEPLPSLKEIQQWILENILNKIPVSRYAKAYTSGRSIKDHVKYHKGHKVVLTLDIKAFFDNIHLDLIEKLFLQLGYSNLISNLLAKLCCHEYTLPQGASTSPRLSNIILNPMDEALSEYCRTNKLRYSRYADDLAFSGEEINVDELNKLIENELKKVRLQLNKDKTMLMKDNRRQIISGIIVNDKIQVPRKKRDELRQAMFYIEKYGLDDHLKKINCTKANYVKHLLGIANYITFINPKDSKTLEIKKKLFEMAK